MVFKNKCSFQNESIKYSIVRWPSQTGFAVKAFGKACSELITIFIVLLCTMFDCTDIAIDDKESIQLALNDITEYPKHLSFKYDIGANI